MKSDFRSNPPVRLAASTQNDENGGYLKSCFLVTLLPDLRGGLAGKNAIFGATIY